QDIGSDIMVIEFPYDNLNYNIDLEPYADQREGMDRCRICFRKRLGQAIEYAEAHNFDFVGTVMSISRFKNSQDLNKIGLELSEGKKVQWLPADFKKNGGYEKSLDIVRKYGLYFQHYCGCKFSIRAKKDEI
ncbi:MAG: epoxyqueuosine reductase QueH, partial [Bacilli bacterium]|nr:epoxyqueuosine reductase QueH [Bacilli bacterium]